MKLASVIAGLVCLLLVPGGTPAGNNRGRTQLWHAPINVLRTSDGRVARAPRGQTYSGNWSGYVLANYQTGATYSSATATWQVPTVSYDASGGGTWQASGTWVGIGGFCENAHCGRADHTLIQLGTEEDAYSDHTTKYAAWYEMLPNPETPISGLTINPGDIITASLSVVPSALAAARGSKPGGGGGSSGQNWLLTLTDNSTNQTFTITVPYNSSLLSAEWIEEAPSSSGGTLPLAQYSNPLSFDPLVSGSDLSANGKPVSLSLSTNGIIMLNPYGETSNPSAPDSDDSGFNTCWSNGGLSNLATCSAPTN
jgi:hypothetical protein